MPRYPVYLIPKPKKYSSKEWHDRTKAIREYALKHPNYPCLCRCPDCCAGIHCRNLMNRCAMAQNLKSLK